MAVTLREADATNKEMAVTLREAEREADATNKAKMAVQHDETNKGNMDETQVATHKRRISADEASFSAPACSALSIQCMQIHLEKMGFDPNIVHKAISDLSSVGENALVEHILTIQSLNSVNQKDEEAGDAVETVERLGEDYLDSKYMEGTGTSSIIDEMEMPSMSFRPSKRMKIVEVLQAMGFSREDVEEAIDAYGDSDPVDLMDGVLALKHSIPIIKESQQIGEVVESEGNNTLTKFKKMGYAAALVEKAVQACGDADDTTIIDYIAALETHGADVLQEQTFYEEDQILSSSESTGIDGVESVEIHHSGKEEKTQRYCTSEVFKPQLVTLPKSLGAGSFCCLDEETTVVESGENSRLTKFERMGYAPAVVKKAMQACGDADDATIIDYIVALEIHGALRNDSVDKSSWESSACYPRRTFDPLSESPSTRDAGDSDDVNVTDYSAALKTHGPETFEDLWEDYISFSSECSSDDDERVQLKIPGKKKKESRLHPMNSTRVPRLTGFGLPGERPLSRSLPNDATGPPYFYFENVFSMPKQEWENISRFLYSVKPEFVDADIFSVCRRPRGYIHNLPLDGRTEVFTPKKTIAEMFPHTIPYWPAWDCRNKLNCICTKNCAATICQRAAALAAPYSGMQPPKDVVKSILETCKQWNLIWVGPNQLAPLEPNEIEMCLGFDQHHTRGVTNATQRLQSLGNSFQINTVAFHLSVLKPLYPDGIRVLSLFAGIGGAEVALERLGIPLLYVVSVEKADKNRKILESWWKKTQPPGRGRHVIMEDVRDVTTAVLEKLVKEAGGFDLVIGGSPCQDLSGNNRRHRVGLEGERSGLFYEFPRILNAVKRLMQP